MFVYLAGALAVFVGLLLLIEGGWSAVVSVAGGAGRFTVFDLSTDPRAVYTLWAGLLGGVALTLSTHGTDQYLVQRLLSARSSRDASRGLVLSGFIVFAQFVLFLMIGAMLFTYYQQVPLPRPLGRTDEVLPLFVVTSLPHGISGFIVAAIVAAALSPSINALAATTVNDFYLKYVHPGADQERLMRVSRLATVLWGVAQIVVALGAQYVTRSVLDAGLSVLSLAAGPVLGAFLTGVLTRRVGAEAILSGMVAGSGLVGWAWWTGSFAWTWFAFLGASTTAGVAMILSGVWPQRAHA
jgi:Na+/proline symporter